MSASGEIAVEVRRTGWSASAATGVLAVLLLVLGSACTRAPIPRDDVPLRAPDGYFPQAEWRESTPEAQGIDSNALIAVLDTVEAEHLPIHSLQILRYGHVVLDAYFYPFERDERHDMASVTKLITTTLVGLALDRGDIASLDAPVYPLLSRTPPADALKLKIRIRDLLTNESGLDCGYAPNESETLAMAASPDWVQFALDLPMHQAPGASFVYCSPGFHLLSALVRRSTGLATEDFARRSLFTPLGIIDWRWPRDPQGINTGGGDLELRPTDLLKIGYLFLREGEWSGRQVVPREWILQATRRHVDTPSGDGYGFGWWTSRDIQGMYQASGRGGQRIIVWSAKDVVMVTTGGGFDPARIATPLLAALKSNAALPAGPEAYARLSGRVRAAAEPGLVGGAAPPLPARAAAINGLDYAVDPNPLGVRSLQFSFFDRTHADLRVRLRDGEWIVPLGLDGAYLVGTDSSSKQRMAGRGRWNGADEFIVELDTIARINHFTAVLQFEGDRLRGRVSERAGLIGEVSLSASARALKRFVAASRGQTTCARQMSVSRCKDVGFWAATMAAQGRVLPVEARGLRTKAAVRCSAHPPAPSDLWR